MPALSSLLEDAFLARQPLLEQLSAEGTDAYRLFHGAVEGHPGLCIDRYGPHVLAQTFREPLTETELSTLEATLAGLLPKPLPLIYNHRTPKGLPFELWHQPPAAALQPTTCREAGLCFEVQARHRGRDPLLFLDMRVGRRFVRQHARGRSVLNLFAYTCGIGVAAAAAGAREVWNVDFARSALEVGARNAGLNRCLGQDFRLVREDVFPVLRQLAGLKIKGRAARRRFQRFEPRSFELVFLDPPRWARSPFGAVDLVRDYQGLFKPALLATSTGGCLVATNNVASVDAAHWLETLERCARKAGRPLQGVEWLQPEADFPSPDGRHPLKIAVCQL